MEFLIDLEYGRIIGAFANYCSIYNSVRVQMVVDDTNLSLIGYEGLTSMTPWRELLVKLKHTRGCKFKPF